MYLKDDNASYGWSLFLFLDAIATVDVLTESKTWVMELLFMNSLSEFMWLIRAVLQIKLTPCAECAVTYFTRKPYSRLGAMFIAGVD